VHPTTQDNGLLAARTHLVASGGKRSKYSLEGCALRSISGIAPLDWIHKESTFRGIWKGGGGEWLRNGTVNATVILQSKSIKDFNHQRRGTRRRCDLQPVLVCCHANRTLRAILQGVNILPYLSQGLLIVSFRGTNGRKIAIRCSVELDLLPHRRDKLVYLLRGHGCAPNHK
jgi:hypothetical protein